MHLNLHYKRIAGSVAFNAGIVVRNNMNGFLQSNTARESDIVK